MSKTTRCVIVVIETNSEASLALLSFAQPSHPTPCSVLTTLAVCYFLLPHFKSTKKNLILYVCILEKCRLSI